MQESHRGLLGDTVCSQLKSRSTGLHSPAAPAIREATSSPGSPLGPGWGWASSPSACPIPPGCSPSLKASPHSPSSGDTSTTPQGRLASRELACGEELGLKLRRVAPFLPGQTQPKKSRQRASLELDGNRPPSPYLGRPTGLVKRKEIHLHLTHMVSS